MVRKQNMEICFQPRYTGCTTFCIGTECQHTSLGVYLSNKTVILFFTVEVRGWNLRFSFDIIKSTLLCLSLLSPSMSIVSLHLPAFLCHRLPYFSFSHSPYLFSHLPSYPPPHPSSHPFLLLCKTSCSSFSLGFVSWVLRRKKLNPAGHISWG